MEKNTSNSDRISENHISGINRVVKLDIVINRKAVKGFKHFRLWQSARRHHKFELILAHDSLEEIQNYNLEQAKKFLGTRITVTFNYKDPENESPERNFVGVVTNVGFSQEEMSLGNIVINGCSPTILMDSAPHTQSFGGSEPVNTTIIANNIIKETLGTSNFDFRVDAKFKGRIHYSSQYCETHYNYLARLAEAYGEQFFYDGEILHFGNLPAHEKRIQLTDKSNVTNVRVDLEAIHTKPEFFGYNSSSHEKMESFNNPIKHLGDLSSQAYELNNNIFKTRSLIPSPLNPNMYLDVNDSQKSAMGSAAVEVMKVSGNTSIPFLYIGCVADIAMRKPDTNKSEHFTTLMITEAYHEVDARGYYKGSFKGISEGTGFMPKPDFVMPKAEQQVATVISNVDPLNQGRIQVRFDWQGKSDTTHFIRMMSPDAGGTGAVRQNRGFVAIPEVGDQVMVGFEYHHPDFPFAMGGMFHGKVALGGGVDNSITSLQTKSGNKMIMNDSEGQGSIRTEDGSTNFIYLDGEGNIRINAPNNIIFEAGNNLEMNAGNNMTVNIVNTAIFNIFQKMFVNSPVLLQNITDFFHTQAGKALISSENEIKIEAKETNVAGTQKLFMHSDESTVVNSKGLVDMHGKQGNNQTNKPLNYETVPLEITSKCIVHFRPKKDWKGLGYGFDYMRKGDTSIINGGTVDFGDVDYETIISKQYTDNTYTTLVTDGNFHRGSFKKDPTKYGALKSEYNMHLIPWRAKRDNSGAEMKDATGKIIPDEYFCSWLAIYPNALVLPSIDPSISGSETPPPFVPNTIATLSLIIDIEEEPDLLRFEDNEYFSITPKEINVKGKGKGKHPLADHITIECLKEFSTDQTLVINFIQKNTAGTEEKLIAGKLKVWANNTAKQKKKKVVFVQVKLSLTDTVKDASSEKDRINNYLRQSLIELDDSSTVITLEVFDTSNSFNSFMNGSDVELNDGTQNLDSYLLSKLRLKFGNTYNSHFKAFYFDETANGVSGYSRFGADYVVVFGSANNQTASHEFLHSLNLPHSFDNTGKFTYEYKNTDNLLDYSHHPDNNSKRCGLWHWQWIIANNSIT